MLPIIYCTCGVLSNYLLRTIKFKCLEIILRTKETNVTELSYFLVWESGEAYIFAVCTIFSS